MTGLIMFVGFVLASGCVEMWALCRAAARPTPRPHRNTEEWL